MAATMTASTVNTASAPMHTSGIFSDMSVDGPEIGTLVVVFDRAKNLPNRRTMGKQDPYCAARLGKEAKKTETDKRGGQTPRWDQELRFKVHDSPDYHNLKLSVFNDDKKTDLIGEAWISLERLLKPGGGQADNWHSLNFKGKYAGEIRIELTFYDSRPRQNSQGRKESAAEGADEKQTQNTTGPRPASMVKRRALPSDAVPSPSPVATPNHANSIPLPQSAPRSYHTPPRQSLGSGPAHTPDQIPHQNWSAPTSEARPLPNPALAAQGQSGRTQASTAPMRRYAAPLEPEPTHYEPRPESVPREPPYEETYTQETPHHYLREPHFEHQSAEDCYDAPFESLPPPRHPQQDRSLPSPPRHNRIRALSSSPPQCSSSPNPPNPAQSSRWNGSDDLYWQYNGQFMQHPDPSSPSPSVNERPQTHPNPSPYDRPPMSHGYANAPPGRQLPPPPPTHRNSAPTVPRRGGRPSFPPCPEQSVPDPQQPLRLSTAADNLPPNARHLHGYRDDLGPYSAHPSSSARGTPIDYTPHRHNSADAVPNQYPREHNYYNTPPPEFADERLDRAQLDYRRSTGTIHPAADRHQPTADAHRHHLPRPYSHMDPPSSSPPHYAQNSAHAPQDATPITKPEATSPPSTGMHSTPHTPPNARKPVPSKAKAVGSVPYSPDSFNAMNPNLQHSAAFTSDSSKEPSPMYPAQKTEARPGHGPEAIKLNDPIIGTDGRVKDPSDHLPVSSYAPEPETNASKRPTTLITVRNRFGPRDAPSPASPSGARPAATSLNSSPAAPNVGFNSARNNFDSYSQKPSPRPHSSPLSPTSFNALNTGFSSPYPPPVPGKIPLTHGIDDYEPGGSMSALSDELAGIDIGPSRGGAAAARGLGGRGRKNRLGL